MSVKVEVKEREAPEAQFNCGDIVKGVYEDIILLVTQNEAEHNGLFSAVVLNSKFHDIGTHDSDWDKKQFDTFSGTITLTQ